MQRPEMPQRPDAQRHRQHPLPFQPSHQTGHVRFPPVRHRQQHVIHPRLNRRGRAFRHIGGRHGAGIPVFIQRQFFHRLAEIARVQIAGKPLNFRHRRPVDPCQPRLRQCRLDLFPARRIVVQADHHRVARAVHRLDQRPRRLQPARRDHNLRIPRHPRFQRFGHHRGQRIRRVLQEHDARAGEKTRRAHGIAQQGIVAAHIRP